MKPAYGDKIKLCMTDTDSFIYEIKTQDFYKDLLSKDLIKHFDTSNMPKDNKYGIPIINKKVLGKFKIETEDKIMTSFIGIRPKMYSYMIDGETNSHRRAKGVSRVNVKHDISHENYKDCVSNTNPVQECTSRSFRVNKQHEIYTMLLSKNSLVNFDDKRYILDDGISSVPYGFKK